MKYRFLILRRVVQIAVLALFLAGNYAGVKILQGNFSASSVFGVVPLSDPFAFLQLLFAGGALGAEVIFGAIIIYAFYAILGGRIFCAYVCPFNLISDLAAYLRRVLGIDKTKQSFNFSRNIRYWIIGIALALSFIFGVAAWEAISPLGILQRGIIFGFGFGITVVLAVFIFDLFALKHGFCGHICPLGGLYSLSGSLGVLRVKYDSKRCTKCMKCKTICPEPQVLTPVEKDKSGFVTSGECTRCGRCVEVCEDSALEFSIKRFIKG